MKETNPYDKALDQLLEEMKHSDQPMETATDVEYVMSCRMGRLLSRMLEGEMNIHLG